MSNNEYLHHLSPETVAAMFKDVASEIAKNGLLVPLASLRDAIMKWVSGHDEWYRDEFAKALGDD